LKKHSAYGSVYKGMQRETGFVLAIKEIFQGGDYEDLKREIEILKTVCILLTLVKINLTLTFIF